jgi:phosphate transport system protein
MRNDFHGELNSLIETLSQMCGLAGLAMERATQALLQADLPLAEHVITDHDHLTHMQAQAEEASLLLLALQAPVAGDLRVVVSSMQNVADAERMGGLALHVAKIARRRMPDSAVPEHLRPTILSMASVADSMIESASRIVANCDVAKAAQLESEDDEMDLLRKDLFRSLLGDTWDHGVEPAVDVALLGRYYERIGDHAVSMARRVVYLVTGQLS